MDPNQDQQNVGPDPDTISLKEFFEKVNFEKKSADDNKSMKNYMVCKELMHHFCEYGKCSKMLKMLRTCYIYYLDSDQQYIDPQGNHYIYFHMYFVNQTGNL